MGIELLAAAPASTVGPWVDCHSIDKIRISLRIDAVGGFSGDVVTIEQSPDSGVHQFTVGTLADMTELVIRDPVDWVRAKCGPSMVGNATVIAEVSG